MVKLAASKIDAFVRASCHERLSKYIIYLYPDIYAEFPCQNESF